MLSTYLKTAWRNILRGKTYSLLNLLGLATGMAVALLIGLWVTDQLGYNHFVPGYERAFRVEFRFSDNGVVSNDRDVCLPLVAALKQDIPEVAHTATAFGNGNQDPALVNGKRVGAVGLYASEEFLQVFAYPVVKGDPATALKERGSVVITESTAKAIFGNSDPMNRNIEFVGSGLRKVTAVIKDLPTNSSWHFTCLYPFADFIAGQNWVKLGMSRWQDVYFQVYGSLKPGADAAKAEQKAAQLVKQYSPDTYASFKREPIFFPFADWHLVTDIKDGRPSGGLIDYVRMFSIVGILVLLIACINFMNLSTARSEKRAREVGVRKVIGSSRWGLIMQFLIESLVMAFAAFVLAVLIVQAVLPGFNAMSGEQVHIPYENGLFWLSMIGYVLFTGLLAGSRPAFYLSSFQPAKVLKGAIRIGKTATLPRKVLVVLQFTCSIALIISTIIVYQQIQYAKDRPRGYDPKRLVVTANPNNYAAYKLELLQSGVVTSVTRSLTAATEVHGHNTIDQWPGRTGNDAFAPVMQAVADSDYFKTLGIAFVAGSNFTGNFGTDSTGAILNEAAVKRMGLTNPINQYVHWITTNAPSRLRIVGVVKNVLTNNPFSAADPAIYVFQPGWTWTLTSRLAREKPTSVALAKIRAIYKKYNPDDSFYYSFADEDFASKFRMESLAGKLAGFFAALAIFISCLGLFGLAAYMAEQRTKEIGIRKVLGASVSQMMLLLSRDFLLLVGVSCLVAAPIAWYFLHRWLAGYYYRITIDPLVFVAAAVMAIVITAMTVGFQAVKSAKMNPVKSLKSE